MTRALPWLILLLGLLQPLSGALAPVSPLGDYTLDIRGLGRDWQANLRTLAGPVQLSGNGGWRPGSSAAPASPAGSTRQAISIRRLVKVFMVVPVVRSVVVDQVRLRWRSACLPGKALRVISSRPSTVRWRVMKTRCPWPASRPRRRGPEASAAYCGWRCMRMDCTVPERMRTVAVRLPGPRS